MFDFIKVGAGALIGAAVVFAPAYFLGKSDGRKAERVARLEADVAAYTTREGIDNEVDDTDRYGICLDLGGLPDECQQLRGVEEAAVSK